MEKARRHGAGERREGGMKAVGSASVARRHAVSPMVEFLAWVRLPRRA